MKSSCVSGFLAALVIVSGANAQSVNRAFTHLSPIDYYWYVPVDAVVSQIYARSDLMRSAAIESRARARVLHAEAARAEIRNSIDRVRAYWRIKEVHRAAKLQKYISQIDRVKYANSERWKAISSLPELTASGAVQDGSSLNFLLNRLDGTILSYDFHFRSRTADDELREELALPAGLVSGIRFRQLRGSGQTFEFNADIGEVLDLSWWPFALRQSRFDAERDRVIQCRENLAQAARAQENLPVDELAALNDAMTNIWQSFQNHFTHDAIFVDIPRSYNHWRDAEKFLKSLDAQIHRLEVLGRSAALNGRLRFDPERDGGDLFGLLTFMVENGLEFAPVEKGKEQSYHTIFRMMRDVYTLVADEDEALQPEKTKQDTVTPGALEAVH